MRQKNFCAWGWADTAATRDEIRALEWAVGPMLGIKSFDVTPSPRPEEFKLRAPRLSAPASLAPLLSFDHNERLSHCYGQSFADLARVLARDCPNPPDAVAFPRNESDVAHILDFCANTGAVAIPYGGGTSVVGGIEAPPAADCAITIDLRQLNGMLEVDTVSRTARIQGGTRGPDIEQQLKPHGLTLRHFMQSWEFSTLGGWIATRSGGHFASLATHIDDVVESIRAVAPAGIYESRRLPASGAGPSPDRMLIGSEGILGVITEAWVRVHKQPVFRQSVSVRFADFIAGAAAVRAISQAGLYPANCRLLEAQEAAYTSTATQGALLVLSFESADHPVDAWMARALQLAAEAGGVWDAAELADKESHRGGAAGEWRAKFLRMPYFIEPLAARGIMATTFESAITWDRFNDFRENVIAATRRAVKEITGSEGSLTCRLTHIYADGPAPYFTLIAALDKRKMLEQYVEIKRAALDALVAHGGTVTHHHAVGREHRSQYDRQRPELFAQALRAAKRVFDPKAILNPGVLIDP